MVQLWEWGRREGAYINIKVRMEVRLVKFSFCWAVVATDA